MSRNFIFLSLIIVLSPAVFSCNKLLPEAPAPNQVLDGPVEGLSYEEGARFLAGDRAFNDEVFTSATGLGPLFVATSCGSCHAGDGKGHPFTTLTRFGQKDSTGNQFLRSGGPQLQQHALPGFQPETIPAGASFSRFTPPSNTGLGFLELVPDQDLLAMADPEDVNGDDISGRPNWIQLPGFIVPGSTAVSMNGRYIHRFGKKAAAYNLLQQTVNAYSQDMGITSSFLPVDIYSGLSVDPEVADQTIRNLVFYLQTLKAPLPRDAGNATIIAGKKLFFQTGCESCHKETLKTGFSPVSSLSNKFIHPYTDLLLHDMGAALDDGYTEGYALSAEWRTPALWGLGLAPASQGGTYFLLHDGRAGTIEQAIELHGGEAKNSRDRFMGLSGSEKNELLLFLKSL